MKKGLINFNWEEINKFSDEQISYFLYLEGKSISCISLIRNLDENIIKSHIIYQKIIYNIFAKCDNIDDFFHSIISSGKEDRKNVLKVINEEQKNGLSKYINLKYSEMTIYEKSMSIWIIGEIRDTSSMNLITRASVNKYVNIRRMAISALGKIGNSNAEGALIRALKDENNQVVLYAIKALTKLQSKEAIINIRSILNTAKDNNLIRACEAYFEVIK